MRRLPRFLLLTAATVVVLTALLVSGLRLVMPHMNSWRQTLEQQVSFATGMPVQFSEVNGKWENFGPVLDIKTIRVDLKDEGELKIGRVTLALDVWQSLLHFRWQFRNLTFYGLNLVTDRPLATASNNKLQLQPGQLSDLFLRQFDHFDLHQSQISFVTPSGQRAKLDIPQLTWLNEKNRHRAEGLVSLSSFTGQHGMVQIRLDLSDNRGYLDTGQAWMRADDVDVKPWLGQWMRDNTSLKSAHFSLAGWLSLKEGEIYDGAISLTKGGAEWQGDEQSHQLAVHDVTAHISRFNGGWRVDVPHTRLSTDGQSWPKGMFSLLWLPENSLLPGPDHNQEVRIRTTNLQLERLNALVPLFSNLTPGLLDNWRSLQPHGLLQSLAIDIPVQQPEKSRFQVRWKNLGWQHWELLPGMEHLSGSALGSVADGQLNFALNNASLPYGKMFRAPLEIQQASGTVNWQQDQHSLTLYGHNLEVKARSLWAKGDFTWAQGENSSSRLDILAGINVTNAGDAWRYFPEPLMGTALVNYLSGAIKGGQVQNASLIFAGNPHLFPFKNNEGLFQVWVPLKQATYQFQPGWPDLQDLDINLDFVNDGLFMKADRTKLGHVQGSNISAVIPDYLQEKLIIDGDIHGAGTDVGSYFNQTPLKDTLGAALDELRVSGDVSGHLHLDIPLDGKQVKATGDVNLNDNQLLIRPLNSTIRQLTGRFTYDNGNLQSGPLTGNWFGQPVNVTFNTKEGKKDYQIGVDLLGDWQPGNMNVVPAVLRKKLAGSVGWRSNVQVTLPHGGGADYQVTMAGDLKDVSSHLPPPLDKQKGTAMPVKISAEGNLHTFNLSGVVADNHRFNSQWLLGKQPRVERGVWENDATRTPALPESGGMILNLPPLDGQAWFALMVAGGAGSSGGSVDGRAYLPGDITLHTPQLTLGGQQWHELDATLKQTVSGDMQVQAKGKEIVGQLMMNSHTPWVAHLNYLYYNPEWSTSEGVSSSPGDPVAVNFRSWPALNLTCDECWLRGQKFGQIKGSLTHDNDTLMLRNGLIDTGSARLSIAGEWVNRPEEQRTALKGVLSGKKINDAVDWFGMSTPLRDSPFNIHYDLHWQSEPWQPSEATLSGVLKSHFGAGQIADVNTGRAAQLLRLVSVDALLRKLRLDFTDTFSQGFWYDSINGTAWIDKGIMHTDSLLVDGLEADIAMQGKVDLVRREIDMEAVVAPEISATVGVAAAFAVNPVVGAAVFAASKVLGPLWNKISVLRYHISGPIDKPKIDEVLRKPREKSAK
ncbi:AsmA2 domain-containing protein YhdP [Erwinia psidii]|uniref:AsmA2 domain-containing protein n=1 Tax=Erwinia psidii TaxID=69224 RepID=A0A3N6S8D9_9GAMM|nr:AsmA2 domain-containing protein YhdP [Erwinia psidii]MCX8958584.1 AsmA2 domain-containing protein [Erwinia psidii]MCX8962088.1 AsmA2 domain-containing protein [Erwinia psidii]MCX8965582.1 AsmA2 domain-containing protein [Erwinia psidii]RQM37420.1 AsmA2 domain-containing protein [Erwinia psidii]